MTGTWELETGSWKAATWNRGRARATVGTREAGNRVPRSVGRAAAWLALAGGLTVMAGCSSGPPAPAAVDTRNDQCAHCRMTVADLRFASQLVAPQEEPRFFDDLGCLRTYLETATAAPGTVAYVADYRTKAWVPATRAVLVRQPAINTPMGSGIIAFADEASRAAEPAAAGGTLIGLDEVFGPKGPPGGSR